MIENKENIELEKELKEIDECRNAVDLLLSIDAGMVNMPAKTKNVYCSKANITLPMECKAIEPERFEKLTKDGYKYKNGEVKDFDSFKVKSSVIIETYSLFKDEKLLRAHNAATPKELLKKLFVSGEIMELYDFACEVNGYGDKEDEIKN